MKWELGYWELGFWLDWLLIEIVPALGESSITIKSLKDHCKA
jgi:hypothetical protein